MNPELLLIIILVIIAVGSHPRWPYARNWGYYPAGGVTLITAVVIILVLMHII